VTKQLSDLSKTFQSAATYWWVVPLWDG